MHTNENDPLKNGETHPANSVVDSEHPGYETTDVNVNGVAVFLAGLFGFVLLFFVFCYGMGKLINNGIASMDGPPDKWHPASTFAGKGDPKAKREDLTSNAALEQRELKQVTDSFLAPRLDVDDGNQATAELHAREDLLLEHYSSDPSQPGAIRIPIERAMQLVAQRGLPVAPQSTTPVTLMAGDSKPQVQAPLTTGFARTGPELDYIEAREQRLSYSKAEAGTQAALAPLK